MEEVNDKYYKLITSEHKWFDLKLKEVWKYKDLIWLFTKRSFTVQYKQTILGPAWLFLSPFLTSVVYTFVFGNIAQMSTDGIPHILFYMASNAIWAFFSSCVTSNARTFTANAHVFGKVYFPRLTTPLSNILSAAIRFGIQLSMVSFFLFYFLFKGQVAPNWLHILLIPFILVHLGIMGMGVGIIVSSLTTKYRDLSILVGFGVSLWMYATPVIYPFSTMNEQWMKLIMMANPVTAPVELYRNALLGQGMILWPSMTWSWLFTIIVALFGIMIFNKVERTFMDTV